jgi:uncharacterized membrane protein YGL010W
MTRKIDALLAEYGESHQNETNKAVHWICVPVIVWTVVALLWSIPSPAFFDGVPYLNWATLVIVLSLLYYAVLSPALAVGVFIFAAICIVVIHLIILNFSTPLWIVAVVAFVLAWIGQFWGHKIEGKKPSFLKDIQFLLIGPAWLLSFLYKRMGIRY